MLIAAAAALLALAVALAGPVPAALARARWPARSPRAALLLWQAVGLGGGLGLLGAGLTLAVSGLGRPWAAGMAALPGAVTGPGLGPLGWAGLAFAGIAGAWLLIVLAVTTARLARARREHRQRLDLLADELALADLLSAGSVAGARNPMGDNLLLHVLEHPRPAAYTLPGVVRPRIVVSRGVIEMLGRGELSALVDHEKAHARWRHDLVIQPFRAWAATFPFLAAGRAAVAAVELLVELAADDAAARPGQRAALAAALRRLAAAEPGGAEQAMARAARLVGPRRPLPRLAAAAVCAAAVALVGLPPAFLLLAR